MRNAHTVNYRPLGVSARTASMLEALVPGEEGPALFRKLSGMLHSMISELHVATWHLEMLQEMAAADHLAYIVRADQEDHALANIVKRVVHSLHEVGYIAGHVDEYGGREDVQTNPLKGFHSLESRTWGLRSTVSMIAAFLDNTDQKDVWSPIELGVCAALESLGELRHEFQLADEHLQALMRQQGGLVGSVEEAMALLDRAGGKAVSAPPSRSTKGARKAASTAIEEATA
jgi:hypothetical protein